MTRLVSIAVLAASLLLWSSLAYSASPEEYEFSDEMIMMEDPTCRPATCGHPLCRTCMQQHGIGLPIFIGPMLQSGHAQRLGSADAAPAPVKPQRPIPMATVPIPVGPPPSSFIGGVFKPQQYQQVQPMAAGLPMMPGQPMMEGQGYPPGYGYAQGYGAQGYPPVPEQRIVYIPYAAPPQIHVERLGKAMPRPPLMRRILGDATMYEYPEMPLRTYTTRGPRDFLAPNPPGIGE